MGEVELLPEEKPATMALIVDHKIEVLELIQSMEGEMSPLVEAYLAEVEKDLATKADKYVIQEDEFWKQAEYFKDISKAFAMRAKQVETAAESLRTRIKITMEKLGVTEVNGHIHSWKLINSKPKLHIDPAQLPKDLVLIVTPPSYETPDRERIQALLDAGETVAGVEIVPVTYPKSGIVKKPKIAKVKKEKSK